MILLHLLACLDATRGPLEPLDGCHAVVATTDYEVGALALVDVRDGRVQDGVSTTGGDPVVVARGPYVFVLDRVAHAIRVHEDPRRAPVLTIPLEADANPQDAELVGNDVWVTLLGPGVIEAYALPSGLKRHRIELHDYAGPDGVAEPHQLVRDGSLYVGLSGLNRDRSRPGGWWEPERQGWVLSLGLDGVSDAWPVDVGATVYPHPSAEGLAIITGEFYKADGGLLTFDAGDTEVLFDGQDLGLDVVNYEERADGRSVVVTSTIDVVEGDNGELSYPTKHQVWCGADGSYAPILETWSWVNDLALAPDGRVWASMRTAWVDGRERGDRGLQIIDPETCALVGAPIRTELDAYSLDFQCF